MEFRFRKGRDIGIGLSPRNMPADHLPVSAVGVMARDFPGTVFDRRVDVGQRVSRGQVLCVDRQQPEIAFVAATAGHISRLVEGRRRRLDTIEIVPEGDAETTFDVGPARQTGAALRALLLESGAWAAFRSRPFGRVPAPADQPSAIFVTATDTNPLSPDPVAVLAPQMAQFRQGIAALLQLTDGPVFVCQPPGASLTEAGARLRVAHFAGPHPAGLAGTHIHHLWPVSAQRSVWQIGCQDVAAIGSLLQTGQIQPLRTVGVAGPGARAPALVRVLLGAQLTDLDPDQGGGPPPSGPRLMSGSILSGRQSRFLGRFDVQVTVPKANPQAMAEHALRHRILSRLARVRTGATVPLEAFEQAFPLRILPVPLMRALAVGDIETAERLGCLELLEEDLALLTWLCPSGCDYGMLLRRTLDGLAQEAAA